MWTWVSQVPQAAAFGPVPDAIANPLCHLAVTQLTCSCPALGMPRSHRLSSNPLHALRDIREGSETSHMGSPVASDTGRVRQVSV